MHFADPINAGWAFEINFWVDSCQWDSKWKSPIHGVSFKNRNRSALTIIGSTSRILNYQAPVSYLCWEQVNHFPQNESSKKKINKEKAKLHISCHTFWPWIFSLCYFLVDIKLNEDRIIKQFTSWKVVRI